MQVVLVMFRKGERREFPVSGPKTIVGRRPDCGLRIPTKDVSREHCTLLIDGEELAVSDLGSSNGTYVNDKRVDESELEPGDRLRVGPVTFVVQINGEPAQIKPEDAESPTLLTEDDLLSEEDDEETFELSEQDFDLDDPISALEELDDEDDLP